MTDTSPHSHARPIALLLCTALWLGACAGLPAVQIVPPRGGATSSTEPPGRTFDNGHRVQGEFLAAFDANGGLGWLGQPISRPILDRDLGWQLQVFEFGVLAQAASGEPVFPLRANVILGRQTPPSSPSADAGCIFIRDTGHNLCHALRQYWERADRERLGLPISEEWVQADGGLTQDFENARLHAVGGSVTRQALGEAFFAARGYDPAWLEPAVPATPTATSLPPASATSPRATAAPHVLASPTIAASGTPNVTAAALDFSNGLSVSGEFLIAYRAAGGEPWLGMPLSGQFIDADLGLTMQVFEYGALAMEPQGDHAFLASVTTLMGRQQAPVPASSDSGCDYFKETGHNVCYQFRTTYRELGPVRMGFPLTEMEMDTRGVLGQDFEYARLEWLNGKVHRAPLGRDFLRTRSIAPAGS